jgi:hypothetical protein
MKSIKQDTVYIHSAFGLWPMLEYELDIAQTELLKGSRVIFLYCQGNLPICEANKKVIKRYCVECKSRVQAGLAWLDPKNGTLEIKGYDNLTLDQENSIAHTIKSIKDGSQNKHSIKHLTNIDGVDIFESALSTAMTRLRISRIKSADYFSCLKDDISVALRSYYSAKNHFERDLPDKVYLFNGRISKYRPMLRLAKKKNIPSTVYEYPVSGYTNYVLTDEIYLHDFSEFSRQLYKVFKESGLSKGEKISVGEQWLNARAARVLGDVGANFAQNQTFNKLPVNFSDKDFNVIYYVSSEDEFAAVKEILESRPCSQVEAIKNVASTFHQISLYVRIHPNLLGVDEKFNEELFNLGAFENVEIIEAESEIDSYSLMQAADLIISFGSTAGIEAAYFGKPVITVGASQYEAFGATVTVKTVKYLLELVSCSIRGDFSEFPNKRQRIEGACAYAFSIQNVGKRPVFLKAENFKEGSYVWMNMFRDGVETRIRANWIYIIYNRLIDRWKSIFVQVIRLADDKEKRSKFLHNPMTFIRAKLFSRLP